MEWKNIKKSGQIDTGGNTLDLSHIQDRVYHYHIDKTEKHPALDFSVLVQYSSHVVSTQFKSSEP